MRRREFIAALGGAAATSWPLAARAQQGERVRRIGVLTNLPETDPEGQARMQVFRDALGRLGWTEGRNIKMEYRSYAGDPERARFHAVELTAMKLDIIFAAPSSALAALQREARNVPIVFAQVGDPVGSGFVDSLARPGGNITGFATTEFAIAAKWIELLKQIAPSVTRVVVFYDALNPTSAGYLPSIEAGARRFDVRVSTTTVRDIGEIERTIEAFSREPYGGLIPLASPLIVVHRDLIISLANRHRLPSVFAFRSYPASGGLASYGVDNIDTYRRAAEYVDRILKGEKPADLPVQLPTKFELVINLKTAKALGLTIPMSLLGRADEVIE
jgi:putative tryptophan/tyrosine transport system substrate-binding protein